MRNIFRLSGELDKVVHFIMILPGYMIPRLSMALVHFGRFHFNSAKGDRSNPK